MSTSWPLAVTEEPQTISQMTLVSDIFMALDKQGVKKIPSRAWNAVIKCANEIIYELDREAVIAPEKAGLRAWQQSDDTGRSSEFLAKVLAGQEPNSIDMAVPHDPDDFGRCVRMLRVCPDLRENLRLMKKCGPIWKDLVENWDELEALYDEAVGVGQQINWKSSGKLFDAIQEIHERARKKE